MKKQYTSPKLSIHGNVKEITQAIGRSPAKDTIFFGGNPIITLTGSFDGDLIQR